MHGHLNVKFTVTHFIDSLPQSTYQLTSASLLATNTAKFALSKFNVTPVLRHSFNLTVTSLSKYQKKKVTLALIRNGTCTVNRITT